MSDAGAGGSSQTALTNVSLIFSDNAPGPLPDSAPIIPFQPYKPSNYEVSNNEFPAPAPAGPYATTLTGAFGGINPNGTWSLYVLDDARPDSGVISGGWVLNIALNEVGPTLIGLVDTNAVEDAFVQVPFTVGSATPDAVTIVATPANTNLVSSIKVGGFGTDRLLNITLVPNASGSSKITVAATDATGTRTREFTLTVTPVNDAPVFAPVPDIRIVGSTNLVLNITDVDTPLSQLVFFASTSGVGLITEATVSVVNNTAIAHITAAPGQTGTEVLTISASDGTQTVKQSFNVTVGLSGPPSIAAIPDVTTSLNQPVSVPLVVTDPDTPIQNLTFFAAAADGLIADARFDLTGANLVVMTITPTPGAAGADRVTVSVSDGTTTTSTAFNFFVVAPGPVIAPIPDQTTTEDVSVNVPITITDADTPLALLNIFASTDNTGLVRDVTFISVGTNVTATVRLVTNAFGVANIMVSASDGTTTATRTFRLTATEVCEPPVIAAIAPQTATGSSITVTIPVTDPDDPVAKLTFNASTVGGSIVSGVTFNTDANGVVTGTFTLFAGATGTEQVTVTASDGCSTGTQTFSLTAGGGGQPGAATLSAVRNGTNFVITVTGTVGASYAVESTSNFQTWSLVDTVTIGANGTAQVTVPMVASADVFFRVRSGAGALAAAKKALFVVGNTTLAASDAAVSSRLATLGYTVTTVSGPNSAATNANGQNLVVLSSTVAAGDVNTKFTTSSVPVIHWEAPLADDFGFTADGATDHGTVDAQTQLNILTTNSPLAGGLGLGTQTISTAPMTVSYGNPTNAGAVKIATVVGNPNQVAIFGYEPGSSLNGTNKATARRVFLFLENSGISTLTPAGLALFDAAINWAGSSDVAKAGDSIIAVSGTNDGDPNSGPPPGAEGVEHAIDHVAQKYLNFLDLGSGFIVTPSIGRTLVNGLRLWTANDEEPRDPASYKIEGSLSGPNGPWTTISEGPLALPAARGGTGSAALTGANSQTVSFSNSTAYSSYRVTFPTLKQATPAAAVAMQIGEVELLGYSQ